MAALSDSRASGRAMLAPPIDLAHGALDITTALRVGAFGLLCVFVAVAGAAVIGWSLADRDARGLALAGGIMVAGVALLVGGTVVGLAVRSWLAHQTRLERWDDVAVEMYERASGLIEHEEITEYSFMSTNPLHVAWLALEAHRRVCAGDETPYSSRALRGPIIVAGRRVGELSKVQAEAVSRSFAQLGLVKGRREGYAGEWVAESCEEVLALVAERWRG